MRKPVNNAVPVRASHAIRIVGGLWKRTRLQVRDLPGLRPTPDRVRETLFNWLGQDLAGWRCLDAFAGTGVLGLEAASRGAADVTLVELDRGLVDQLMKTAGRLNATMVRVVRGDGVAALRQSIPGSIDLVFLDPPFDSPLFEPALRAALPALSASGFVYLEAPLAWPDEQLLPLGLTLRRHLKAGAVHAHLLARADATHA
jgi:16S rRNA (guanine(966)-N(2))-methyltransferase RsmD